MEKLRFEISILPTADGKTNVYGLTSITTTDNRIYGIPEELQSMGNHKELLKTAAYIKVKNSISKRFQTRRVWISMTEELKKTYMDEDGNLQFGDQYLEELDPNQTHGRQQKEENSLEKILTKLIETTQDNKQQNLKQIAEKFVIEKFNSKNTNASQWIQTFEKECIRFEIKTDEKKIEVLRLFMDKCCMDWYNSMNIKFSMDSDWSLWKQKFCESFANKGWNPVTHALLFRYKEGSLLDYAIRKEKLLLDMRNTIDSGTLVDLIAAGLPEFVLNKIDREVVKDTVDLFNEINKCEHMVNRRREYIEKRRFGNQKYVKNKEPCKNCEKLKKGTRYHPESTCWFRTKEEEKKNYIKQVNNSTIEAELNENCQKNE